jgi:hypothetical protein
MKYLHAQSSQKRQENQNDLIQPVEQPTNIFETRNFFGNLAGSDLEEKKQSVLEMYKLIFRFSIEKLLNYLCKDTFIVMLLSYVKDTSLERFHQRPVLMKNVGAYYRSIENMINYSERKEMILKVFTIRDLIDDGSFIINQ